MQPLYFYNSRTKQKEHLTPITPQHIKLYVCGITVYDYCHLGHARFLTCFDVLVRSLRAMDYQVTYVRNITDIDDKIIQRAAEQNQSIHILTDRFISAMHEDERALAILTPDHEPRATEYIPHMIALIEKLIAKGFAYVGAQGDVYYAVHRFDGYGQLSGQNLKQLRAGIRVSTDELKQDPLDFVLWKSAKPDEPNWDSPWGPGRPGWHIECSAMSCALLGTHFDIHGGGMDLLFPHHENEVAQSVAGYDCEFANVWLHNGFVQVDQEKMSKSLGNFLTIRHVLEKYSAEALRYFLLASHYRSPISYSDEALQQANQSLDRIYTALRHLPDHPIEKPTEENYSTRFFTALADDLNTPEALAVIFELTREVNRLKTSDQQQACRFGKLLRELLQVLAIGTQNPEDYFKAASRVDVATIEDLIAQREQARLAKDWQKADALRNQLLAYNVICEDTAQGVTWRISEAPTQDS
jgi:cysteinyl-tRNA synthetase